MKKFFQQFIFHKSLISVFFGIVSILLTTLPLVISKFFYTINLPTNSIIFSYFGSMVSGALGMWFGIKFLKVKKNVSSGLGLFFSLIGFCFSCFFVLFAYYLGRF